MRLRKRLIIPVVVLAAGPLLVPAVADASASAPARSTSSGSTSASGRSSGTGSAGSTARGTTSRSTRTSATTRSSGSRSAGASAGVAAGRRTHIVRSGDTVTSIARSYGVSADSVRAANGIVDDALYLGARLIIDGSASASSSASSSSGSSSASTSTGSSTGGTYTVKDGDYLDRIARRHHVSLSALLEANDLQATSLILPGDELDIPGRSSAAGSSTAGSSKGSLNRSPSATSGSRSAGAIGPDLRCPVPGASFMNDWGFPRDDGGRFHEGTDMFAPGGTTVVAPASGSVVFGSNHLGGTTFTLTTNSGWVVYGAHLSKTIGSSRTVHAGEAIAKVGNSGNAAGGDTHLHVGLKRLGFSSINPYPSLLAACG